MDKNKSAKKSGFLRPRRFTSLVQQFLSTKLKNSIVLVIYPILSIFSTSTIYFRRFSDTDKKIIFFRGFVFYCHRVVTDQKKTPTKFYSGYTHINTHHSNIDKMFAHTHTHSKREKKKECEIASMRFQCECGRERLQIFTRYTNIT